MFRLHLWLLATCVSSAAFAQTSQINVSHDLVALGIAGQNIAPNNPNLDATPMFQAALNYAKQNHVPLITADTGAYYFLKPLSSDRYMNVQGLSNLTIDLQGSDVYTQKSYLMWLCVIDSQHVTLTNFTIDSLNLPFTQVQLTGVASRLSQLSYQTLPGWPSPVAFNGMTAPDGSALQLSALVFRNGNLVPNTNRVPISSPLQNGVLQVAATDEPWAQPRAIAVYQPGDTVVFMARGGEAPILVTGGDSNVVSNVDVYSSGAIALHLDTLSNSTIDHVRVLPKPGTDRLISSNADGLHLSFALANNRIQNSYVNRTVDDGIAINAPFLAFVNTVSGAKQIQVTRNFNAIFPNGLAVQFVNTSTVETLAGGSISAQNPAYSDPPPTQTATLTFSQSLPSLKSGYGMIYGDPANRGSGSLIQNNVVEDVLSARGIYLGGVNGVTVQRNTIRRTNCGAIVGHEDVASYPVGPNENIQILNNTIENAIGPSAVGTGTVAAIAAIMMLSTDQNFNFVPATPNTNITVSNNTILDSGRAGIWISNSNGGAVQNNTIMRYYEHPTLAVYGINSAVLPQLEQDFTQPVVVRSSNGVTVQNNTIQ